MPTSFETSLGGDAPDTTATSFVLAVGGWAHGSIVHTERLVFTGDRAAVRAQTAEHALQGLLTFMERL